MNHEDFDPYLDDEEDLLEEEEEEEESGANNDGGDDSDTGQDGEGQDDEGDKGGEVGQDTANGEGADKNQTQGITIPKARFDSVREQLKAERARSRELEERVNAAKPKETAPDPREVLDTKLGEIDTRHSQAVADGNHEEAARCLRESRTLEREYYDGRITEQTRGIPDATRERIKYDTLLEQFETAHPEINPDAEEHDETLYADVVELVNAYQASGQPASQALNKAMKLMFPLTATSEATVQARKTDVVRNLKDAKQQPPQQRGGLNSDKVGKTGSAGDVMKMSDTEFAKLSEQDKARARGDEVSVA